MLILIRCRLGVAESSFPWNYCDLLKCNVGTAKCEVRKGEQRKRKRVKRRTEKERECEKENRERKRV